MYSVHSGLSLRIAVKKSRSLSGVEMRDFSVKRKVPILRRFSCRLVGALRLRSVTRIPNHSDQETQRRAEENEKNVEMHSRASLQKQSLDISRLSQSTSHTPNEKRAVSSFHSLYSFTRFVDNLSISVAAPSRLWYSLQKLSK